VPRGSIPVFFTNLKIMAAKGKNWYDTLLWVEKVIKSCKTPLQGIAAKKLAKLYLAKYREEIADMDLTIYYQLMDKLDNIKYKKI
jgi:hypothetical protein